MPMAMPELLNKAADASGGQVDTCQVTFMGLCRDCVANQGKGGET